MGVGVGVGGSDGSRGIEYRSSRSLLYTFPRFNICKRARGHDFIASAGKSLTGGLGGKRGDKPGQGLLHCCAGPW